MFMIGVEEIPIEQVNPSSLECESEDTNTKNPESCRLMALAPKGFS